jgi:hypothetical protein
MHKRTPKTKAWIILTAISSPDKKKRTKIEIYCGNEEKIPIILTLPNPAITFNKAWPAIIFANSRIDKLIGLKKKDINSIGTNNNPSTTEVPLGKNNEKNWNLYFKIQITFIPINKKKLKKKVTIKWLVTVKLPGTSPIRFRNKTKKKVFIIRGKKWDFCLYWIFSSTNEMATL